MRKHTISCCVVLAAAAVAVAVGCQGELKLNDGVGAGPRDMATASAIPANLGFVDINSDLQALGCTNNIGACHGGTNPTGLMALQDGAGQDMAKLMANYNSVVPLRVDTTNPSDSKLVKKPLDKAQGGTDHVGGNAFFPDKSNPMYQRWVKWVQLGAKFETVPTGGM